MGVGIALRLEKDKHKNCRSCCLEPSLCLGAKGEIRYAHIGQECCLDVFIPLTICAAREL